MALRGTKTITVDNTISNTSVNLIQITEDKLENILMKHVDKMKRAKSWISAAGLFLTLVGLVFATDFKDWLGISKDTWKGIFGAMLVASAFYLGYVVRNCWKSRDSIENIIMDIKNEKCGSEQ